MKSLSLIITTGFALFSMFFGSGNLVFPLLVGMQSENHFLLASLGIIITGVLIPFIGVLAMLLYKGDARQFLGTMGEPAKFWFPLIALSLMGPFGVLARCITVAHGSFALIFPQCSLIAFSTGFCLFVFLLTANKNRIIPLLGSALTPFLLLALLGIITSGIWYGEVPLASDPHHWTASWSAFRQGAVQGYQTMDLLAAFFFSTFIIDYLSKSFSTDNSRLFKVFIKSALLGGGLLALIYCGLVYLGSAFASELQETAPQAMLGVIAQKVLGTFSAPFVCIAVVLACFTTATVLAFLFADFFRQEVCKNKVNVPVSLIVTLLIAFGVSTLEFSGIAAFLGPILETLYPALIVLTLVNIANKLWGTDLRRWPIVVTLIAKICSLV